MCNLSKFTDSFGLYVTSLDELSQTMMVLKVSFVYCSIHGPATVSIHPTYYMLVCCIKCMAYMALRTTEGLQACTSEHKNLTKSNFY